MENNELSDISKKLDILIKLTALNSVGHKPLREQIRVLDSFGLRPIDIAQILGKSPNHINVELNAIRKQKGGGKNE